MRQIQNKTLIYPRHGVETLDPSGFFPLCTAVCMKKRAFGAAEG
jgi:hypothetical protein